MQEYGLFDSPSLLTNITTSSDDESYNLYKDMQRIPNVPMPPPKPLPRRLFRRGTPNRLREEFHDFLLKLKRPVSSSPSNCNDNNYVLKLSPIVARRNSIISSNIRNTAKFVRLSGEKSINNNSIKTVSTHLKDAKKFKPKKRKKKRKVTAKKNVTTDHNFNKTLDSDLNDRHDAELPSPVPTEKLCLDKISKKEKTIRDFVIATLVSGEKQTQTSESLLKEKNLFTNSEANGQAKDMAPNLRKSTLSIERGRTEDLQQNFQSNREILKNGDSMYTLLAKVDDHASSDITEPAIISLSSTICSADVVDISHKVNATNQENVMEKLGLTKKRNLELKEGSLPNSLLEHHKQNNSSFCARTLRSRTQQMNSISKVQDSQVAIENILELTHNAVEVTENGPTDTGVTESQKLNLTQQKSIKKSRRKNNVSDSKSKESLNLEALENISGRRCTRYTSRLLSSLTNTSEIIKPENNQSLSKPGNNIRSSKQSSVTYLGEITETNEEGEISDTIICENANIMQITTLKKDLTKELIKNQVSETNSRTTADVDHDKACEVSKQATKVSNGTNTKNLTKEQTTNHVNETNSRIIGDVDQKKSCEVNQITKNSERSGVTKNLRKKTAQQLPKLTTPKQRNLRSRSTQKQNSLQQFIVNRKSGFVEIESDSVRSDNADSTRENGRPKRVTKPPKRFIQATFIGKNDLKILEMSVSKSINKRNTNTSTKKTANKNNKLATNESNNNNSVLKDMDITQDSTKRDAGSSSEKLTQDLFKKPQGRPKKIKKPNPSDSISVSSTLTTNLTNSISTSHYTICNETDASHTKMNENYGLTEMCAVDNNQTLMNSGLYTDSTMVLNELTTITNSDNECQKEPKIQVHQQNLQDKCEIPSSICNTCSLSDQNGCKKMIQAVVNNQCTQLDWFSGVPKLDESKNISVIYSLTNMRSHMCLISCGFLIFGPGQEKSQIPLKHSIMYKVEKGHAAVTQQLTTQVMERNCTFYIPLGSPYKIKNLSDTESLVLYFHKTSQIN